MSITAYMHVKEAADQSNISQEISWPTIKCKGIANVTVDSNGVNSIRLRNNFLAD